MSRLERSIEVSPANDSSENESEANEAVASKVDLSILVFGDDVKMLGVDCLAGVLTGEFLLELVSLCD